MLLLVYLTVGIAALVAILSVLRGRLVFELQATSHLLLGSDRPGIFVYSLIMLPGTIIHELSHWLVAELLRVPTGKITILPEIMDNNSNNQRLGSVATATTDPIRSLLIGAAPFATGLAILTLLAWLVVTWWGVMPWWYLALLFYGLMVVGNSMLVSAADRHNWPIALGFLLLLATSLWYLGLRPSLSLISSAVPVATTILQVLGLTAALNLATIGACALVRHGIQKLRHKQIYRH